YYVQDTVDYTVRSDGATRVGKVVVNTSGSYTALYAGKYPTTPAYVNTVSLRDQSGNTVMYDIFSGLDTDNDGRPDRFYAAYTKFGSYMTAEFADNMTVALNGSTYRGQVSLDSNGNVTSVSLYRVAQNVDISSGYSVNGKLVMAEVTGGTYAVNVGASGERDIDLRYFGASYYADRYDSDPYTNTVTLDDGRTYEVAIDPLDPSRSTLVADNITGYAAPNVSVGGKFS
ncbi:hypothetical protein LDC_1263, partial [sediment metagenome]